MNGFEIIPRAAQLLADGDAGSTAVSFDIAGMIDTMASALLSAVGTTVTSLIPVITTMTVISYAIHTFRKYCK